MRSYSNGGLPTSSLTSGAVDSSDPAWLAQELDAPPQGRAANFQEIDLNGDAGLSQVSGCVGATQCSASVLL